MLKKIRNNLFIILFLISIIIVATQSAMSSTKLFSGVINRNEDKITASDMRSYFFASKHLLADDNLYFAEKQKYKFDGELVNAFVYPPLMSVVLIPFNSLSFNDAYIVFSLFSTILLILSIIILVKYVFKLSKKILLLFIAVSLTSPAFILHIDRGQTDIIIFFLISLSLVFIVKNKNKLSGIINGIAVSLKITPLIFIPYFYFKNKKALYFSIVSSVVGFIFFPINTLFDFIEKIKSFSSSVSAGVLSNSLTGTISEIIKTATGIEFLKTSKILSLSIILIIFFIIIYFANKNKNNKDFVPFEFGTLSALMIITPGISWLYNSIHLIIIFLCYVKIRNSNIFNKWLILISDIICFIIISTPALSPSIYNLSIRHIFSIRPVLIIYLILIVIYYQYLEHDKNEKIN